MPSISVDELEAWLEPLEDHGDPEPGALFRLPYAPPWLHAVLPAFEGPNHAAQLCWASNGDLLAVWMAGSGEGTAGMNVVLSRLSSPAGPWSDPERISEDDTRSEQNPLLWCEPSGRLHLLHTAQEVRDPDAARDSEGAFSMQWTARLRHRHSDDHGHSWSSSRDLIDTTAFCRHPPLLQQDGSWYLPIYRSTAEGGLFGHDFSEILHLEADLSVRAVIPVPNSLGRVHGSLVPSAVGNALLLFFRSRLADRIYRAQAPMPCAGSSDPPLFSEPVATDLPNNNSSIQALRLSSGRLALIFNRFGLSPEEPQQWGEARWPRTRWPLSVAISDDDGRSWPWIRDIMTSQGFCGEDNWFANGRLEYPTLLEGPPGVLHAAFSWMNQAAIRYVRCHEFDVLGVAPD
jgi:predicted neuraminidase